MQYTTENGFQGAIKCQGDPLLSFAQAFSVLILPKKLPEQASTKTWILVLLITQPYVCGHISDQPTLN